MSKKAIIKQEDGFSLVELIVTMVIFVLVMTAASGVFTGLLTQFKQQSKIAETNVEGIVGLEMMRQDIEHAGYGVPWIIPAGVVYTEAASNPFSLNDASSSPRAIMSKHAATYSSPNNIFDGSDYLIIRSVYAVKNDASQKWTTLSSASPYTRTWSTLTDATPASENLASTDRVIVIAPGTNDANAKTLIADSSNNFYTTFANVTSSPWPPLDASETRIVYGVDPGMNLKMPFNRADYLIRRFDGAGNNITPSRCAPFTGILEKAILKHDDGGTYTYMHLLDCVADMQVVYALDMDEDGAFVDGVGGDTYMADVSATLTTAQLARNRVKEVRIYILAHEGQKDPNFTFPSSTVTIPPSNDPGFGLGRTVNLATMIGDPEYKYYRWKIYTLVVKPIDLR